MDQPIVKPLCQNSDRTIYPNYPDVPRSFQHTRKLDDRKTDRVALLFLLALVMKVSRRSTPTVLPLTVTAAATVHNLCIE